MSEAVYVALGSNLGHREAALALARACLDTLPGTQVVGVTEIEETEPIGGPAQGPYLNQMLELRTTLSPRSLLKACQAIEAQAGRRRTVRWGPRTLDIDIVQFGTRSIAEPDLQIPHPQLAAREFWRRELSTLAAHGR